jgi:hypothetical protein
MRKKRAEERLVPYRTPPEHTLKHRDELEANPPEWLRFFFPETFICPFSEVHIKIIKASMRAMRQGTSITVAAPRGYGKTRVLWGMAFFAVLTGLSRFPVVIGWKQGAGRELLDQWLTELSENQRLREYYPCQCDPFEDSTASIRLKKLLREVDGEKLCGCNVSKEDCVIVIPDVQEHGREMRHCALGSASMNGSIKGKNKGLITGENLRPDIVLLDDPQDQETAESADRVKKVIRKMDYGIRSLSGPQRRLTVMSAVTCVTTEDVSEHLLTRPGTEVIKTGQIVTWPDGWKDEESKVRAIWDAWNKTRIEGLENIDGGKAARDFYVNNKEQMTKGMTVSWEHRLHIGDDFRVGDPDALFAAIWDFYDLGENAFMAERQNDPIQEGVTEYKLSVSTITKRQNKEINAGVVPDWVNVVVAATDVNPSYALTTTIIGFDNDQRAAVLWYGTEKMSVSKDIPDAIKKREIMAVLEKHGKRISDMLCRPFMWGIDGGGSPKRTIIDFSTTSAKTTGLNSITMFGRAYKEFKPKQSDRKFEEIFIRSEKGRGQWSFWNADYWKEIAQKSWLGAIGAPGTCELPKGNHVKFAEQICREKLAGKTEVAGTWAYIWKTAPGKHDYGDCMGMCFALASCCGVGTGMRIQKPKRNRRRVRHVRI